MPVFRLWSVATLLSLRLIAQVPPALDADLQRLFGNSKEFAAKKLKPFRWNESGDAYTVIETATEGGSNIIRYDIAAGRREVLVPASRLKPSPQTAPLAIDDYEWSKDGKRLLLFTNAKKVWRNNTRGDYWIFEPANGKLHQVGAGTPPSSLMFARWSPDGTRVAYVRANNIYVEDAGTGHVRQLTTDGSATIVNGTSDWVTEEELFLRDCFRWSPDSRRIAYWQFDTSGIGVFTLINTTDDTYPTLTRIPYPKAGTTNSAVRVGVVDAGGGKTRWFDTPGDPRDRYISLLEWTERADELILYQLNRLQNQLDVSLADARTGKLTRILEERDSAYIDINGLQLSRPRWLDGGQRLLWVSERDGWRHLYTVSRDTVSRDGRETRLLTPGSFDAMSVAGLDEERGWVYYIASPDNATQRYLYRTKLDGSGAAERVTPSPAAGTNSYDIAPGGRWAIHTYSNINTPPSVEVVSLPEHKAVRNLVDNSELAAASAPFLAAKVEFLRVDIGDGIALDGWLLKPAQFDPARSYPLLIYVYGEPWGVTVTDSWDGERMLFHRALANAGYLVASFDNRSTPSPRGSQWRHAAYGSVGVLSSKDQAAAVRSLARERSYIDAGRVAIWGWSGGGTNTLNAIFRYPDVYRVGMSVAPVPDQRLYDTIYQERYMGLPQKNELGYKEGSAINHAEGLQGRLLVVHGSGDDNVHYQGTERLVNRLVELGKDFDLMVYPNRTHAINEGKGTSLHLHRLLARYLIEHLPAGPRP